MTSELGLYAPWTKPFYLKEKKISRAGGENKTIIYRFVHKSDTAAAVQHMPTTPVCFCDLKGKHEPASTEENVFTQQGPDPVL